jgi:DNA-binding NarL/FixJ family response regulator
VRIAIVEPVQQIAEALYVVFGRDPAIEIVATVSSPIDPALAAARPDLAFIDVDEIELSIEETVAAIEHATPRTRICAFTNERKTRTMQRVLSAKADAYIVKDTSPSALVEIVHSVAVGEFYADPRVAGAMLRRRTGRVTEARELSTREYEIVRLIAEGLSNREIGKRLTLSEKTVKNHVSHILAKLKVTARSGVAVYAVRNGLIK